jgi:hypothetical protein
MNASASPFLSLSVLIRGLRGSVGGWGGLGWLGTALVLLLYRRLGQICSRMEGLVARFEAGTLRRRDGAVRGAVAVGGVRQERIWPCGFGWLVKAAGWQAAGFGSQLRAVLATPEMVALLEASPQAVRVLQPLCRMLAIESCVLRPRVVKVAAESAVAEKPKRVRAPRAKVDWGRIPIPRGVLSAVRRGGFAKA